MKSWGLLIACVTALCPAALPQSKDKLPRWRIDPYTRNEPEVLERLGYVSYGPFGFGQRGAAATTTEAIDEHLHYAQILWVETAHFKIGSALEAWTVPFDPEIRDKVRAELTRLKDRGLPRVNPKTRRLDPWLRLHLFAQRLEDHYAEVSEWLGVTDSDFPADAEARARMYAVYMGEGPYLGQKGKYLFLLFENKTTYDDYLADFTGRRTVGGQQWNFKENDELLYACAADTPEEGGRLRDDTAMHGHVLHAATHSLLNGYLHYNYDMPVWIREGLAHWFERRVSPRFNSYTRSEGSAMFQATKWDWEPYVRALLPREDKYAPFSEVYTWRDFGQMDFDDHVMIWSRWDYLMTLGKEKFAVFLRGVKGQIDPATGVPNPDLVGATREALTKAYGLSPLTLEERWKAWVVETYSTR